MWIDFALDHIVQKVASLPKDYLGGSTSDITKEEFIHFITKSVDTKSPEYRELYHFLLKTFQAGDTRREGRVTLEAFDLMIEAAAAAPRRFGLAPTSHKLYKNKEVRCINYFFEPYS